MTKKPFFDLTVGGVPLQGPLPTECPLCHVHVLISNPIRMSELASTTEVVFQCSSPQCHRFFIATYGRKVVGPVTCEKCVPVEISPVILSEATKKMSPDFSTIYHEARTARAIGLGQICGPGFRKALEFLIKDYAKARVKSDERRADIEGMFAGDVIKQHISDQRLQAVAQRALWVGNDETHYRRVWDEMGIQDLETLIELTLRWIEIEEKSGSYVEAMKQKREG